MRWIAIALVMTAIMASVLDHGPAEAERAENLPDQLVLPPRRDDAPQSDPSAAPEMTPETLPSDPIALCGDRIAGLMVKATVSPPISEGPCGREDVLQITSLGTRRPIPIAGSPRMSCQMAAALARWLGDVVDPAARAHLGSPLNALPAGVSYACRTRNHQLGARLSEHGKANAFDIGAFTLTDGRTVHILPISGEDLFVPDTPDADEIEDDGQSEEVTAEAETPPEPVSGHDPASPQAAFQRTIRAGACGIFTTVLGPGADAFHDDHLHLDMARRRNGAAYCR